MDNTVLAAIITVSGGLVICILSLLFEQKRANISHSRYELYKYLLANVYQPLYVVTKTSEQPVVLMEKLSSIYAEYAAYIPPKIETMYLNLSKEKPAVEDERYHVLVRCIESDYNEIRKSLGMAYRQDDIFAPYVSYGEIKNTLRGLLAHMPFLLMMMGCLLIFLFLGLISTVQFLATCIMMVVSPVLMLLWFNTAFTRHFKNK